MTQLDGIGFQIFDEKVMSGSLAGTSVNNFKEALADVISKPPVQLANWRS